MSIKLPVNKIFCNNNKVGENVTLQVKLDMLKWFDAGEPASETALNVSLLCAVRIPGSSDRLVEAMERLLGIWWTKFPNLKTERSVCV
jgi:hypothetical protein